MRTQDELDHFAQKNVCRKEGVSLQEFVDDLAMTSMARLWDVGKSEPIKACVQRMGFGVCFASFQVCFIPFALWCFVKGEVSLKK